MTENKKAAPAIPAPLTVDQVLTRCTQAELGFTTSTELEPLPGILGQGRALQALKFGVNPMGIAGINHRQPFCLEGVINRLACGP